MTASDQNFPMATGTGGLEASRGTVHVGETGDRLTGEITAFGGGWAGGNWFGAGWA